MTASTEQGELENLLLSNPFDIEKRKRYADLLLDASHGAEALVQYELLCQQQPEQSEHHIGAARALLLTERKEEAVERYRKSRKLTGFVADQELTKLEEALIPKAVKPRLQVVSNNDERNVVKLTEAPPEKIRFDDIIGADELKRTIRLQIIEPFINPGLFQRFRKQAGGGILLYGPPGCGKTMMAKAVANECHAEFISVGIGDVLNMWIGESERNLAAIFEKARATTPSVLFFDEIDALAYSRSKAQNENTRTVVNEFLAQLDGMGSDNRSVLLLAATNMPWDIDSAIRRPGRFARQVFVPPPDALARLKMLEKKLAEIPCDNFDFGLISIKCEHYSGADIDGLIELAKERALMSAVLDGNERPLNAADFDAALSEMVPSTLDWLRTARNLVKFAGSDRSYKDVETYLKSVKFA